jgi:hypothetical protein
MATDPFKYKGYYHPVKVVGYINAREIVDPHLVGNDSRQHLTPQQWKDRKSGMLYGHIQVEGYEYIRQAVVLRVNFEGHPEIWQNVYLTEKDVHKIQKILQKRQPN